MATGERHQPGATPNGENPNPVQNLVQEYKTSSHTAELVTNTWQAVWSEWGNQLGAEVSISPCDRTDEEIAELEAKGRMLVFVPQELSTIDQARGMVSLITSDPEIQQRNNLNNNPFENIVDQSGWLSIEASERLPHSTPEDEIEIIDKVEFGEAQGQTINTYLVGTAFNRLVNGRYLDPGKQSPYNALLPGSRIGYKDGGPARYVPYVEVNTNSRDGNINNLLIWSFMGDMKPRQIRTAELKEPTQEQKNRTRYGWEMNVLHYPPTAEDWNRRLGNGTGEQVAELLSHIHEPERILSLERPQEDIVLRTLLALKEVEVEVRSAGVVTLGTLQEDADKHYKKYYGKLRYPGEPSKTYDERLATYMQDLLDKHLDNLVWGFVKDQYDVEKAVAVDIDFFGKLWRDGIEDRIGIQPGARYTMWRTYRHLMGYEANLIASKEPEAAAKVTPLREICESGNFPIGIDHSGNLIIVTS